MASMEDRYPWETAGTHELQPWEEAFQARMPEIMIPERPAWVDLIETRPRQNGKMAEMVDRHLAGIVTSAPTSTAVAFDLPSFQRAMDAVIQARRDYERVRYVIPRAKWHSILEGASDNLRADLDSLAKNGTVIVSDYLPDPDMAYRIEVPRD